MAAWLGEKRLWSILKLPPMPRAPVETRQPTFDELIKLQPQNDPDGRRPRIKMQSIGDRVIIHERSYYELTIARAVEDDALCIALRRIDDDISRLAPGILCAKLNPDVTMDQAEVLLSHMNAYSSAHQQSGPDENQPNRLGSITELSA